MKYSEFSELYKIDSQLRATRAKKATPATTKATSNPHEDESIKAEGEQAPDKLPKGYKGPVFATFELPRKQLL